jgi:hypothetical protein
MAYFDSSTPPASPSSPIGSPQDISSNRENDADEGSAIPTFQKKYEWDTPWFQDSSPRPLPRSTTPPPTLPECPLEEWIMSHPCWRSNAFFTRTEDATGSGRSYSYLASLKPIMGFISKNELFGQHLGLLSDLRKRESCDVCQTIYQDFKIKIAKKNSSRMNMEDASAISCNIIRTQKPQSWYYMAYVSGLFNYYTLISRTTTLTHHIARIKADFIMLRM